MLPTTVSHSNHLYSYDDFTFFDTREEHENLIRKNSPKGKRSKITMAGLLWFVWQSNHWQLEKYNYLCQ
jgi:hypothetical protein